MAKTVYTMHAPEAHHLEEVKAEMLVRGAPVIRVVDCTDYLMALEWCHRIAAAHELGLQPVFEILSQDEEINITGFDWFDAANWDRTVYPAGEVAGELFSTQAVAYRF